MGEVKLNSQPGKWFYLEGQNPCTYTNVHLISSDGFFYRFNAAMLAASRYAQYSNSPFTFVGADWNLDALNSQPRP